MWVWVISVSFVVGLLLICWTHWLLKWRHPKCNAVLPPGSIRETLQYLFCPSLQVHSGCSLVLRKKDSKGNIYAVFSRMNFSLPRMPGMAMRVEFCHLLLEEETFLRGAMSQREPKQCHGIRKYL
ncbi:hypothetical protein Peur_014905 [Populus x canadensis]